MTQKQIPKNWQEVALGEVLDYEQPTNYIVESINYNKEYKTPVLTAGKSFILGYTNETEGIYSKFPVIIFDDFTTDTKFVNFKFKVKSSAMKLLRPKNEYVDIKFIYYMMKMIKVNSSTHKRYYLSLYQNKKIHLPFSNGKPDLEAQKKIVSILEKTEALKSKNKKANELFDEYLKSIFYEMFYSKGFDEDILNNIVYPKKNSLKRGPFGGSLKKEIFVQKGFKVYEQQNAIHGNCTRGSYYITPKKFGEMKDFSVKTNDIIISCSGTIGKLFILPENCPEGIINQALLKISLDNKKILPIFFKFLFEDLSIQNKLFDFSHGSGIKNFPPMSNLRNLKIPLPPLELQQKFASIVEHVEKLKVKQKKELENTEELFDSLMQRAFRGELV